MDTGKIERAAVRAVEEYIDGFLNMTPDIHQNDKTPIWDGDIFLYDNAEAKAVKNFVARVPLQVKGTTEGKDYFYIEPEYIKGFKADRGCIFFVVNVNKETLKAQKILYAMLSSERLDQLLKQTTKNIRIDLNDVPVDSQKFERDLFAFAAKRNGENIENSSPEEIAKLVEEFEKIRECLGEIKDNEAKYELESLLDSIKNTRDDGTIGWRDKFIYYSRKALDLATKNIYGYDLIELKFNLGSYLHDQKLYQYVEDYYFNVLEECRKRTEMRNVAATLNNLAVLHYDLSRFESANEEYKESLEIYRELAKANREEYIKDVAMTLNNLGNLNSANNCFEKAKKEYHEALDIYRELAVTNHDNYISKVATTLNNLGNLNKNNCCYEEAEEEYKEALKIRRDLAETNRDVYIADVAMTLNNLAILHKLLSRYEEAEEEYKEALIINRELACINRSAYIGNYADTLGNLGNLHCAFSRFEVAEMEYQKALEIYRDLTKTNHDAYIGNVSKTLNNLAVLHYFLNYYEKAELEYQEALEIYRDLAKTHRDAYIADVAMTLSNLANLHKRCNRYVEANKEMREALVIYRELATMTPDAYIGNVAHTLFNLALLLQKEEKWLDEARAAANEALGIFKELAKSYPQIWNKDIKKAQDLLDGVNQALSNPPAVS